MMNSKSSVSSNERDKAGQKKKGGGYLARQAKAKKSTVTEDELSSKDIIAPEDVLKLARSTSGTKYKSTLDAAGDFHRDPI